ncbi:MAG: hypothetical protein F4X77_03995 [Acidobacteriia bacterium]|nr:hypothetical protein [Terriglobia bacterium]MYC68173.1 hypothetical protein [Terriglobia bacterium]
MLLLRHVASFLVLATICGLQAQELFDASPGSPLRFHPSDRAVLADDSNRSDFECQVVPQSPLLGFDLKFTAGYVVRVPARTVGAAGDSVRILFRVKPAGAARAPAVYFRQNFDIPHVSADGGTAAFPGRFVVGPGQYQIDWLMRNQQGRVCSAHWTADAHMPSRTALLAAAAPTNLIRPYREHTFADEPPVARATESPGGLHIALLVNLAPLDRNRFKLTAHEIESLVAMLRTFHREPGLGLFSLTAFHAYNRQVVYTVERQPRLDFAAFGRAIESMPAGVVDVVALADEDGDEHFLSSLLNSTFDAARERPDAVVIMGPKIDRDAAIAPELLNIVARPGAIFQFSFNRNPRSYPWPGAIEAALRPFGLVHSNVTRPQDFSRALAGFLDAMGASPSDARAEVAGPPAN